MSKEITTRLNVQFTQADTFANITSGENISTSFGKLASWYGEIQQKIDTEATYADVEALFGRFLTFQGTEPFTLGTANGKYWDGIVEYSTDLGTWETWDGTTTLSSGVGNILYLRGKNNTKFATLNTNYTNFVFTTTGTIECNGDIRRLLDYENPGNTTMDEYCYYRMFYNCTSLTKAPDLPATILASNCYYQMFIGCTRLTEAPALPATTLADYCYRAMFYNCTRLTTLPELPATTLADYCYEGMFTNCKNIKISETQTGEYQTPYRIPSTGTGTAISGAMNNMFYGIGGTFTGTPEINTTYYTSNTVVPAS